MAHSPSTATESVYVTRASLWRWKNGNWYFLTLPERLADEIRAVDAGPRRVGFGTLRVTAQIGETRWQTSIFPSAQHRSYLLPVKAQVRKAEGLVEGRSVRLRLTVRRAW